MDVNKIKSTFVTIIMRKSALLTAILLTLATLTTSCNPESQNRVPSGIEITADGRMTIKGVVDFKFNDSGLPIQEIGLPACKLSIIDNSYSNISQTIATISYTNDNAEINLSHWPVKPVLTLGELFADFAELTISNAEARVILVSVVARQSDGQKINEIVLSNSTLETPAYTRFAQIIYSTADTKVTGTKTSADQEAELNIDLRKGWNSLVHGRQTTGSTKKIFYWANGLPTEGMRWTTLRAATTATLNNSLK